ncbi:MAG: hypothetical protein LBS02_06910 [Hungatella sp.]|nr:hypothetical protein [Hungatella sp.]MDR2024858.1 hypothetical protein [Hungatella sp.]
MAVTITADVIIDLIAKKRKIDVRRKEEKLTAQVFVMAVTALPAGATMMIAAENIAE